MHRIGQLRSRLQRWLRVEGWAQVQRAGTQPMGWCRARKPTQRRVLGMDSALITILVMPLGDRPPQSESCNHESWDTSNGNGSCYCGSVLIVGL